MGQTIWSMGWDVLTGGFLNMKCVLCVSYTQYTYMCTQTSDAVVGCYCMIELDSIGSNVITHKHISDTYIGIPI